MIDADLENSVMSATIVSQAARLNLRKEPPICKGNARCLSAFTVLHCAEGIFHFPALRINTTVVTSDQLSSTDFEFRTPLRIAVSPKRRTNTPLRERTAFVARGFVPPLWARA
jgi:hypothetical protein